MSIFDFSARVRLRSWYMNLKLIMVNEDIGSSPVYKIKGTVSFEYLIKRKWIWNGSEFTSLPDDFNRVNSDIFNGQFSKYKDQSLTAGRYIWKISPGRFLGTSTAWDDPEGKFPGFGMIHWIAVIPEFQKKGLGRIFVKRNNSGSSNGWIHKSFSQYRFRRASRSPSLQVFRIQGDITTW
jgi:GNAT superfamily N-acetyltransferase